MCLLELSNSPSIVIFSLHEMISFEIMLTVLSQNTNAFIVSKEKMGNNMPLRYVEKWRSLDFLTGIISPSLFSFSTKLHNFCASLNCRDVDITEKLDYSSAVALLGYSLLLAILRSFNVRDEATRVMISAPLIAFVATHILFINFYKLDYGTSYHLHRYIISYDYYSCIENRSFSFGR